MKEGSPHKNHKSTRKKFKIELKEGVDPFNIKKYLTLRNFLIFFILFVVYLIYPQYIQPIIVIIIFYPIALFSTKASKVIKTLNLEMITSFTIFIGYLYGFKWAFFFGFILGTIMWSQTALNSMTMINCVTYIFAAYFGSISAIWFPNSFMTGYLIAVTLKNIVTFFMFLLFNPSPIENLTHTFAAFLTNTIIAPIFLNMFYRLIMFLTPG